MKSYIISVVVVMVLSCSKKDKPMVYATESFPQKVILVMEDPGDNTFYDYFSAQATTIRRAEAEKSDDAIYYLFNSSHAYDCVWIANIEGNYISLYLKSAKDIYLQVAPSRLSDEYFLTASLKNNDNSHLFKRHHISSENSVEIVTIESVMYPGYFLSREGIVSENNAVKLVKKADAKEATKVRWYNRHM